jgi:hypothetical protein
MVLSWRYEAKMRSSVSYKPGRREAEAMTFWDSKKSKASTLLDASSNDHYHVTIKPHRLALCTICHVLSNLIQHGDVVPVIRTLSHCNNPLSSAQYSAASYTLGTSFSMYYC